MKKIENKKTISKTLLALAIGASLISTAAIAQEDTLSKIKNSGVINLGVRDSSGLGFALGNGKYVGFHTEMAERIIDDIKKSTGNNNIKTNYQVITSQNRIPLLKNGTIDFECGSTTNNKTRQKDVDFAYTTFVEEVKIATKKNANIKSVADLNGKTIAVTTGTTSVQHLRRHERGANIEFKTVQGKDHADSFLLLEAGRADAFVMDGSILAANISRSRAPNDYIIVDEVLNVEPIACMVRKDDKALKEAINASIKRQISDGSLAALYDKWFMKPIPPHNVSLNMPLSSSTKAAWDNPNDKPMEDYAQK